MYTVRIINYEGYQSYVVLNTKTKQVHSHWKTFIEAKVSSRDLNLFYSSKTPKLKRIK